MVMCWWCFGDVLVMIRGCVYDVQGMSRGCPGDVWMMFSKTYINIYIYITSSN